MRSLTVVLCILLFIQGIPSYLATYDAPNYLDHKTQREFTGHEFFIDKDTWSHFIMSPYHDGVFFGAGSYEIMIVPDSYIVRNTGSSPSSEIRVSFPRSNPCIPYGNDAHPAVFNIYRGNDPGLWKTGLIGYKEVVFENLYDSIDLHLIFEGPNIKTELLVHPGGDPDEIRIDYGTSLIGQPDDHHLEIQAGDRHFREGPLLVYQEDRPVDAHYIVEEGIVRIWTQDHDIEKVMIIDPLLTSSTFIGGSGWDKDPKMVLDPEGSTYIAGVTDSPDLPTTSGSAQVSPGGDDDLFISKMNEDLSGLVWLTYLGGSGYESLGGISLVESGNVMVGGSTTSDDLPTTANVINTTFRGGYHDGFMSLLSREDGGLMASTYIGGSDRDRIFTINSDLSGNAIISGFTSSSDLWIHPGAHSRTIKGDEDSFVMVVRSDLSTILRSTLIGGSRYPDRIFALDVMDDGYILLAGQALSNDFPITSGVMNALYGSYCGFITVMDPDLESIARSTFTGNGSWISSVALHDDQIYLTGKIMSASYPTTPDAFDRTFDGEEDAFLTMVSSDLTTLIYSTFIGANEKYGGQYYFDYLEGGSDIAVGDDGKIYICGYTDSTFFPITLGAFDSTRNELDGFFMIVSSDGKRILHSTFLGGADEDRSTAMVLDGSGYATICGHTYFNTPNSDFPTTVGAYDRTFNGGYDITLTRFKLDSDVPGKVGSPMIVNGTDYLHLSWEEPNEDGNEPVLGYKIYRSIDPKKPLLFMQQEEKAINDTTVIKGIETFFWIAAYNKVGEGERTMISGTAFSTPSAPSILSTRIGDGSINITWDRPFDTGGYKTLSYNIYLGSDFNESLYKENIILNWVLISGLENGMNYSVRVSSSNPTGEGPPSDIIYAIPLGLPTIVRNLICHPKNSALFVSWDPPISSGGAQKIRYVLNLGNVIGQLLKTYIDIEGTELNISGLVNGRSYTISVCAYNDLGKGDKAYLYNVTPLGRITEVTNIIIYQVGKRIVLEWDPPENTGGSMNITYNVYQRNPDGHPEILKEEYPERMYVIDNVTYGLTYTFMLSAYNGFFEGVLSPYISITPYGLPSPPKDLTVESMDDTVQLEWKEPIDLGGDVSVSYNIYISIEDDPLYLHNSTVSPFSNIHSLKKGTRYNFAVSAMNVKGEGPLSEKVSCTPTSVPGPPTNLRYNVGSGIIYMIWSKPNDDGGMLEITYNVFMGMAPDNISEVSSGLTIKEHTIDGLTNGRTYFIAVQSVNGRGGSKLSEVIAVIPLTHPDAPVIVDVISGDGWLDLYWDHPESNGGGDIWLYHIFLGDDGDNLTIVRSVSPSTRSYRLTPLTNGRTYSIALSCENSFGMSPLSSIVEGSPEKEDAKDEGLPVILLVVLIASAALLLVSGLLYVYLRRPIYVPPYSQLRRVHREE